jgi:UDP-glucose 4-epimerase
LPPVIFGDGTQTRDFIFVADTVRALLRIAGEERCIGQTVNVGRGSEIPIAELARLAVVAVGRADLQPIHAPARPGDVLRLCARTERVAKWTGFTPQVSFPDGLARTAAWFRFQPADVLAMGGKQQVRNWEAA